MSTTSIVIMTQAGLLLLVLAVLLALYARRQKKTVIHLQETLRELKEELSGETLVRYLQLSRDDCLSHAQNGQAILDPGSDPDAQALALRYHALAAELSNLQTYNGELTPLDAATHPYLAMVESYQQHLRKQCDRVRDEAESDQTRLNHRIEELSKNMKANEQKLRSMRGLINAFAAFNDTPMSKDNIELHLHTALLDICDTLSNPAPLREVVYVLHESYQSRDLRPSGFDEPQAATEVQEERSESADTEGMMKVIEQFTEESAEMVERIHLLTNQNKQLKLENEQLKKELTQTADQNSDQPPSIAGMKLKIEQQAEEMLTLQLRYRDLENQYLALYEESGQAR